MEFQRAREVEPEPLTLRAHVDVYDDEVTPAMDEWSQRFDGAATRMFLKFFGGN